MRNLLRAIGDELIDWFGYFAFIAAVVLFAVTFSTYPELVALISCGILFVWAFGVNVYDRMKKAKRGGRP